MCDDEDDDVDDDDEGEVEDEGEVLDGVEDEREGFVSNKEN